MEVETACCHCGLKEVFSFLSPRSQFFNRIFKAEFAPKTSWLYVTSIELMVMMIRMTVKDIGTKTNVL